MNGRCYDSLLTTREPKLRVSLPRVHDEEGIDELVVLCELCFNADHKLVHPLRHG